MSPKLETPARDRCMAALTIAQEAMRHIARIAPEPRIQEAAAHALNKIGILMTDGD